MLKIALVLTFSGLLVSFIKTRVGASIAAVLGFVSWGVFVQVKQIGDGLNAYNVALVGKNVFNYEWGFGATYLFLFLSGLIHIGLFFLYMRMPLQVTEGRSRVTSLQTIVIVSVIAISALAVIFLPRGYDLFWKIANDIRDSPQSLVQYNESENTNIVVLDKPVSVFPVLSHIDDIIFGELFDRVYMLALTDGDIYAYELIVQNDSLDLVPLSVIDYGDAPNLTWSLMIFGATATAYDDGTIDVFSVNTGQLIRRYDNEYLSLFRIPS